MRATRALAVAASSTPAFVTAAAAATRGAALAAGQQRLEAADGVDGVAARGPPLLVARQRRLHAVEVAQRAPGARGPRSRRPAPRRRARRAGGRPRRASSDAARRQMPGVPARSAAAGCCAPRAPPRPRCGARPARLPRPRRPACSCRSCPCHAGPRAPPAASARTRVAVSRSVSETYATSCSRAPTAPNSAISASQFCSRHRRPTSPTKSRPPRIVSSGSSVRRREDTGWS